MQQDDQNTFKIHTEHMSTQNPAKPPLIESEQNTNPIHKRNLLSQGFNYILPSFWYQQLIELNNSVKSLQNIQLPSFQTYMNFLSLSGLQNPTESTFHTKQQFPKESALSGSDILQECYYINSKTVQFSKINNTQDLTQIQWTVINPVLWNFIESKYQLSLQNLNDQSQDTERPQKNKQYYKNNTNSQSIPKIAVFFTKEFIHEKGRCKGKEYQKSDENDHACFIFKNVKYTVPYKFLNEEIHRQLAKMTSKPISMTLIIDQALKKNKFFRKLHVSGFFSSDIPWKEFAKGLIELEPFKNSQKSDKFFIYDEFGQKIAGKITIVQKFVQISERKRILISTSPINEIVIAQNNQKRDLVSFLETDFNYPDFIEKQNVQSEKIENSMQKMEKCLDKLSREKQFNFLLKAISKNQANVSDKPASKQSGFKPYKKESNEIKILNGTFYRSEDSVKSQENQNNQENDEIRYLDSATTNLDTPAFEYENQSEKVYSHSNYENARLKKHSSYNRTQRKKKSLHYIHKKKKNNYILRGTALNNPQTVKKVSETGDYKKRIKFPLFHSLCSLDDDPEALDFIIQNMRKLAKESIQNTSQHIQPIDIKYFEVKESKDFTSSFETTETKTLPKRKLKCFRKQKDINEIQREQQIKILQQSLHKISSRIQRFYEPQIELEKGEEQQKGLEKSSLDKFYEDYEFKKDNEEIKTIIDNSQGPYSEVQKHSFRIKYRGTEKNLRKITIENDEIKSLSDGLNSIEDNDETI